MRDLAQVLAQPRVRAPELAGLRGWLNVSEPLSLQALRGHVVVLDFWTYCCINCLHVLPDLKRLEAKHAGQPLVVVGVHSGKFDQEKDEANIRAAIFRHQVAHPVAVDSDFRVWKAYAVRAWPTLVVIDVHGRVVGTVSGEGHRRLLDELVDHLLEEGRAEGALSATPLQLSPQQEPTPRPGPLSFPGKVLADAATGRLFISDTAHHRVLVADLAGQVSFAIGTGRPGLADGPLDQARLNEPQGLALSADGETLFVADRESHALRAVSLGQGVVTTLAGMGEQGFDRAYAGPGRLARLNSPWDLARVGDALFIAMAGTHQIWRYDLVTGEARAHAGTGAELCLDGPLATSAFAQPSGLAVDGDRLLVADSEVSTLRSVDLSPTGQARSLAGSRDLFGFGHQDGPGDDALFQHPLGVAVADLPGVGQRILVADTYNHRVRAVDPRSRVVTTLLGSDRGVGDADAIRFDEPNGLSVAGDDLFVADTNNHRVVVVSLTTLKARALEVRWPG